MQANSVPLHSRWVGPGVKTIGFFLSESGHAAQIEGNEM